jgi:hypothetical protein
MADRDDERAEWGWGTVPARPEENVWASLVRATAFVGGVLVVSAVVIGIAGRILLYLVVGK